MIPKRSKPNESDFSSSSGHAFNGCFPSRFFVSSHLFLPAVLFLRGLPLPTEWLETLLEGRKEARAAGTFALSFFVYKIFAPLRIGSALILTPYVYRFWKGKNLDEIVRENIEEAIDRTTKKKKD